MMNQEHNKLTVGELFDSVDGTLNPNITTEVLMAVADIGQQLLNVAICRAHVKDNADFFVEAYDHWGPVVDAVLEECCLPIRDTFTGQPFERRR